MTPARFQQIHQGLTSVAKKVYDAVPIAEPWNAGQIATELGRQGRNIQFHILSGCLNSLAQSGLVVEQSAGLWIRVPVRPKSATTITLKEDMPTSLKPVVKETAPAPVPATDLIAKIAGQLKDLSATISRLAHDIEDAVLEVEQQQEAGTAEVQKLRQLKTLLKELG